MTDEARNRETEAFALLTNRILMDYLSLQIDSGQATVRGVQSLIAFSATEVVRGAAHLETEVRAFERMFSDRFDQTFGTTE